MAIHKPDKSGKASRQGDLNSARPGHGNARPRQDPRPHQRNHQATEQATRQAAGDSSGQQSHNLTNAGSQACGIRSASYIPHGRPSSDNQEIPHFGSGSSSQHQVECTSQGFRNTPLPLVAKSSQTQVSDKDGAVASQMDIKSMKGENTHHWYSHRPGDRMWGETCGGGVDDLIEDVKKRTGAASVQFTITANIDGRFEQIAAKEVERTWEDNNGYNDKGKPAGILRHGVKIHSETKKPTKCASCGNKAHKVATCFSKIGGKDGEQSGCPLCDTNQHHGGDCKEIAALPLPEQVKMLIVNRGNMVPFKGKKPWWKLLHEYCTSPQYDSKVVTAIPWSKEFTLALAKGRKINHMQLRHDTLPAYKLPKDEAFADPTSIYWKYWQPENLAWPAAFGNLPGRPSGPIDTDGTKAAASQTGAAARAVAGAAPCVNPVATPAPAPAPQRADPGGLNLGVPPGMASSLNLLPRPAPVDGQVPTPGNAPVAAQASVIAKWSLRSTTLKTITCTRSLPSSPLDL
ncbi:uncharacterized protein FPRN_09953 [Fusarium proliferatum]|nr:uncharacterized protein FPRN_09953 [Fusarium proliferatum]